jgi:enolase
MPTLQIISRISNSKKFQALASCGTSVGYQEKADLRDDKGYNRFSRNQVSNALSLLKRSVSDILTGVPLSSLEEYQERLDLRSLPSNISTPVSILLERMKLYRENIPLSRAPKGFQQNLSPTIQSNFINGGLHSNIRGTFQEHLVEFRLGNVVESINAMGSMYSDLRDLLASSGESLGVGLEGGFVLSRKMDSEDILEVLQGLLEQSGFIVRKEVGLSLDCAGESLAERDRYLFGDKHIDEGEYLEKMIYLIEKFHLRSVEDPFDPRSKKLWSSLRSECSETCDIIGDDLFCSKQSLLESNHDLATGCLLKPNQVGTLRELEDTIVLAKNLDYRTIMSHRSGDTEDPSIADLAVRYGCDKVKFGAPRGGERTVKYNRLIELYESALKDSR